MAQEDEFSADGSTRENRKSQGVDIDPDNYDVGVFRQLMDDVRTAHQHELESYVGKKEMGWRLVQFNSVLGTIGVAVVTQIDLSLAYSHGLALLAIGGVVWVASTVVGMYIQRSDSVTIGPKQDAIDLIRKGDTSEVEYLAVFAKKHDKWRSEIAEKTTRRSFEVYIAMSLSLCGLALFLTGVVVLHAV